MSFIKSNTTPNGNPTSTDNKDIIMSTSRPENTTTYFTCQGDDLINNKIGGGTNMFWDFSNTDNDVIAPAGFKRKEISIEFIDRMWLKEGAVYFGDKLRGSYIDLFVVCPAGQYYVKNDGTPALATEDVIVSHYANHIFMSGNCPMGDELNTESCSGEIPNTYKFKLAVTVPDSDNSSFGYVELEFYRERTAVLE